jgi:hypothetical protein
MVRRSTHHPIKKPLASRDILIGAPGKIPRFARADTNLGLAVRFEDCEINQIKNRSHRTDFLFGAPGKIRTYDLLYRKQTLYPAELRVLICLSVER